MTAHKHAAMIKAKADNMELVKFNFENGKWIIAKNQNKLQFMQNGKYFLCLLQHKEACLHWLNGGDTQYRHGVSQEWDSYGPIKTWTAGSVFMQESLDIRIKPSKEKRWIVANPRALASMMYFESEEQAQSAVLHSTGEFKGGQVIEIEVEV